MDMTGLLLLGAGLLVFASVSKRIEGTVLTAPMIFTAFGILAGPPVLGWIDLDLDHAGIHLLAEITLVLVLFSDAAKIDIRKLRTEYILPLRMLGAGLPLAVLAGAGVSMLLFPDWTPWEAALLAAILAPTDAALGQAVVTDARVPERARTTLNVESGLNDGIALPAVLVFAALASGMSGMEGSRPLSEWLVFAGLQIALGPLAGIAAGFGAGRLIGSASKRGWLAQDYEGAAILVVPLLAFSLAEAIGGNGLIAAFVAGMTIGSVIGERCSGLLRFMENEGQALVLLTFFVFGAGLFAEAYAAFTAFCFLYAVLSLTVVRMVPIGLSLAGSGVRLETAAFFGWFGPRGLASILFALLILEEAEIPHKEELLAVVVATVLLSTLLHGLTAAPWAGGYGARAAKAGRI